MSVTRDAVSGRWVGSPRCLWNQVALLGPDECWPWLGPCSHFGHGRFFESKARRAVMAHREAYRLAYGVSADDMPEAVCHLCDNPPCCNPDHLRAGTRADNALEMYLKGRSGKTYVSDEIAAEARAAWERGETQVDMAKRLGIARETAWAIINRRGRWAYDD